MSQHQKKKIKKEKDFGPERCLREVEKVGVFVCPEGMGRNYNCDKNYIFLHDFLVQGHPPQLCDSIKLLLGNACT